MKILGGEPSPVLDDSVPRAAGVSLVSILTRRPPRRTSQVSSSAKRQASKRLHPTALSFPLNRLQRLLPVPANPQVYGPPFMHRPHVGDPRDDLGPTSPPTHV